MKTGKKLMWITVVNLRELIMAVKTFNPYHDWVLLQPNSEENGSIQYWALEKCACKLWSSYLWEVTAQGTLFYIWCSYVLWQQHLLSMTI